MDFNSSTPIYRQITDYCFGRILSGAWPEGERVPSVRELSVQMAVNPRTVIKAFEYLEQNGLISSRRGLGYFLAPDARSRVEALRRDEFVHEKLPALFGEMDLLGITPDDLLAAWQAYHNK